MDAWCGPVRICCLGTARGCLPRPGHRYMQRDALRACIMDVHYGTVTVPDSGRSQSVRLIVVVVYTWSATVLSAALQNIMPSVTVIKQLGVQQKLLNISKVDGQRSAVGHGAWLTWMGDGRAADITLAASSAWTDDVRR